MLTRSYVEVALGCAVLLLAGCGSRPGAEKRTQPARTPTAAGGMQTVTLHVEGMTKRLGLFWLDWKNKVQEALSGLPGVESVEVDLENDRLSVEYDPSKLTPQDMLESVGKQGFAATIVSGGAPAPPWLLLVHEEALLMRSLLQSLLGLFSPKMVPAGSNKTQPLAAPTDVTLHVPGMNWPRGWPDRVRSALGTLPWVEQATVQTDIPSREVRFNLKDRQAFNEEALRAALKGKGFPEVSVKADPK